MLYSKCDIDFSAMGSSKPKTEEAIEFKGTLESAVHEVRMEAALDTFFLVHERCDFEEMALNAYVDAHGNEAILENSLTVIREASENQESNKIIENIKKRIKEVPGMISKALSTIGEKISGASLEKLKERIKGIKNVKVEMPDFKSWGDRIIKALTSIKIFEKLIAKMKRGDKVTKEEIKEEMAKSTGGDANSDIKASLNLEKPEAKSQTVDGGTFIDKIKEYAGKFGTAVKDAGTTVKNVLSKLPDLIANVGAGVVGIVLFGVFTAFSICLLAIGAFIGAVVSVVSAIWNAGKSAAGAVANAGRSVANAAKTVGGAAAKAASAIKNTKKDEGNFSGETVEA